MKKITLTIKDEGRIDFLVELLKQFDFIEIDVDETKQADEYDFFASAGLWKNRKINVEELRNQAWQRNQ